MSDDRTPSFSSRLKALATTPVGRRKSAPQDPVADAPEQLADAPTGPAAAPEQVTTETAAVPADAETTASFGPIGEETEQILATDLAAHTATFAAVTAEADNDDEPKPKRSLAVPKLALPHLGKRKASSAAPASDSGEPAGAPAAPQIGAPPEDEVAASKPSFTERAALRRRMKALRARRDVGLLELGAIVLDQRRFGDASGGTLTRQRTDELTDIDGEIAAIELALDEDHTVVPLTDSLGVVHCVKCSALLGPADNFCANCGTPRPEPHTQDEAAAGQESSDDEAGTR